MVQSQTPSQASLVGGGCETERELLTTFSNARASSCTDLGNQLRSNCDNVVSAVNQNADNIVSATCQGLRNAVANAARSGVTPAGSCCSAVQAFIKQGCSCDQQINNLATTLLGYNANTIKASTYVAQVSTCGPVCNPCGNGPCGCGGAAPA
ncbi:hypothetical protein WJX81_004265 [Elliptochloris bilobata]|uniref:Uncharacterized protein n=1 Tax=Elliptochloris bilobata TaxID=381761 RepID=A0AAW1QM10_9CHLO